MKFNENPISYRLTVLLGFFLLASFPTKVLALANDVTSVAQQHFSAAINSAYWTVSNGPLVGADQPYSLHLESSNPDTNDVSAQGAELYSTSPFTTGVTVTYTDAAGGTTQNFLEFDLYTNTNPQQIEIIATDGVHPPVTASFGSTDVIQNCFAAAPVSQGETDANTWETAVINVAGLNAITNVQFIFQDNGSMGQFTGAIYLDNLRGASTLSCGSPTPTPVNSYTPTYTATVTVSPTQTYTPTATFTAHTPTVTNTPTITATPLATNTPTPAACQPEVYPNPMDFTAVHNEINVPGGACDAPGQKCIIFSCVPLGSTVKIYTVSLSLVRTFGPSAIVSAPNLLPGYGIVAWDGLNGSGGTSYAASGLYFYVINGPGGNTFGKFAISKSIYGP